MPQLCLSIAVASALKPVILLVVWAALRGAAEERREKPTSKDMTTPMANTANTNMSNGAVMCSGRRPNHSGKICTQNAKRRSVMWRRPLRDALELSPTCTMHMQWTHLPNFMQHAENAQLQRVLVTVKMKYFSRRTRFFYSQSTSNLLGGSF